MQTQSNKFQELIENHAFQGRDVKLLSKDQRLELVQAYLVHKNSRYPWSECKASDSVDVGGLTMGTLANLCSNIYNNQLKALEAVKDAVMESYIGDVDEILDEEIEKARHRYSDDNREYQYEKPVNLAGLFNVLKKASSNHTDVQMQAGKRQ